jgi:lipopolysaccharide transport system ATP-binding protein
MSSKDIAVSVRGVSKSYTIAHNEERHVTLAETLLARARNPLKRAKRETFWALNDVSFDIKKGDVVGIIGRNGAGKSTLLKILSRITEPTKGEIEVRGRIGSLLEVGTGFHPELTGRENVFLNGAILGMSKAEIRKQFDAIVEFAGVEKFLDTPVKRYSSGMYVRLAFAVAAHLRTEILIVDEVLSVGDSDFQRKCLGKMQDVSSDGRTVLFVSHNMAAIQSLCNIGLMLKGGRKMSYGSISETIDFYLSDDIVETEGFVELTNHPSRVGLRKPWLKSLTLQNKNGQTTSRFSSSEELSARVVVRPPRLIRNPLVAIAIEDQLGRRITTSATNFTQLETGDYTGEFVAFCDVGRIRLGPGRYMISVSVSELGSGLLDSIDGAGWFEVEWDNSYPTGAYHDPVYGPVVTVGRWQIGQ